MPKPDVFSVPRRFDLATVLVAMFCFAALFAGLRLMGAPPSLLAIFGGLVVAVAIGQGVAAKRNCPRKASMAAGIVYWLGLAAVIILIESPRGAWPCAIISTTISSLIWGALTGYLSGALVGGVFLVSHHLRETWGVGRRRTAASDSRGESLWDEKHPLDE
jgi:hypothetical protein